MRQATLCLSLIMVCSQVLSFSIPIRQMSLPMMYSMNWTSVGHMISLLVINEMEAVRALTAVVKTTEHITHVRDTETGSHLDRMSRYSRLIAVCSDA